MSSSNSMATVGNRVLSGGFSAEQLIASGAVLISFSPVFVLVAPIGPNMAGFYRTMFGGLILGIIALARGETLWRRVRSLKMAVTAALFFGLGLTSWHRSILAVGSGLSTILANFQVFFLTAMGAVFLKERIGLRTVITIPVAVAGICLMTDLGRLDADLDYRTGVIFGLLAALAYACYVMALRKLQTGEKPSAQIANFAVVSLICAAIMAAEGWLEGEVLVITSSQGWLAMIAYGVLCQALAWMLISIGLPLVEASRTGLLLLLEPTGAFLWDILFFAHPATGLQFLGAGLALAAIYYVNRKKTR